jgi:hypothetical protein
LDQPACFGSAFQSAQARPQPVPIGATAVGQLREK